MSKRILKKYLLIAAGSLALGLGCLGIFLPLLPTTPFLLLAAYCYLRSSPKLHAWLLQHRVLGIYINNYLTHGAITASTRTGALVCLWLSLSVTIYLIPLLSVRLLLFCIGLGVSIHLFSLKTLPAGDAEPDDVS